MPYAKINGQNIYFEDSGGKGPAVVFAHGFLMDQRMFDAQVEALAPEFRVIRWDARGFGKTEFDGRPFTYWDSAADCIGLLDHLGLDRAVIGGMSQGGYMALRAALKYPDRVKALVLIDTQADADPPEAIAGRQQMIDTWLAQGPIAPLVESVAGMILGPKDHWEPWVSRWKEIPPERLREPGNCLNGRDDVLARVSEIACPTLVIHGTDDIAIPITTARDLARRLPACKGLVEVEGAAHAPNLTHPDVVNPALLAFLRAYA